MKIPIQQTSIKDKTEKKYSARIIPIAISTLHIVFSPILALGFILINPLLGLGAAVLSIVAGVKLLKVDRKIYLTAIHIHKYLIIFYAILGAYGIFAIIMNMRSAVSGGGLLGGLGELIIGLAIILTMFSLLNLVLLKLSLNK